MKKFLSLLLIIEILASCSIERRLYMPGFHIEGRNAKCEVRGAKCEVRGAKCEVRGIGNESANAEVQTEPAEECATISTEYKPPAASPISSESASSSYIAPRASRLTPRTSHLAPRTSYFKTSPDTLKKPFKPQKQYREIDPVGKVSVMVVLAGIALQKVAGILTWFEVIMPLSFGPGIFIPAFAVVIIGLGISVYSAYRVRKYPEKYKKNEWGKAALAILGWQIIMSALFAWLLGGLPIL